MTMANIEPSQMQWDSELGTGLEEFDASDATIPRLSIDHLEGVLKDNQTEETFDQLDCIMLGLLKQRLMWPTEQPEGNEKDVPLCQSPDFAHGFPNMNTDLAADKRFPWDASNFSQKNLLNLGQGVQPALKCEECRFKDWGSAPNGDKPWCSEEFVIPLLYWNNDTWNPAVISFHRSALKSVKKYISPFSTKKLPLFTAVTTLSLDPQRRGNVKYCLPVLTRKETSNNAEWNDYLTDFRGIRDLLKAFPRIMDSEDGAEATAEDLAASNTWDADTVDAEVVEEQPKAAPKQPTAPKTPAAPKQAPSPEPDPAPAEPAPAAAAVEDDDEEPPF